MNPLTQVKQIQKMSSAEAALGVSEGASWHAKYKDSAYVFVGGIPYELTEGDLVAVFSQYGEIVDVNLVRDKGTGKSKGFAFLAYEDQRSTVLAVDYLNGAKVLGRIVRVDHVSKYKKKEEEEQRKREERGVCRAFQRGECTRGDACKFSHNEMRAANTGWGERDESNSKWDHDKYDGRKRNNYPANQGALNSSTGFKAERTKRRSERDDHRSRKHGNEVSDRLPHNRKADGHKEEDDKPRGVTKQLDKYEAERGEKGDSNILFKGKEKMT